MSSETKQYPTQTTSHYNAFHVLTKSVVGIKGRESHRHKSINLSCVRNPILQKVQVHSKTEPVNLSLMKHLSQKNQINAMTYAYQQYSYLFNDRCLICTT